METRYADGQGAVWEGEGLPRLLYAGRLLMAGGQSRSWFADQSVECLSIVESFPTVRGGSAL